jgi:hypothetical protein
MGLRAWIKRRHGDPAGQAAADAALERAQDARREAADRAPEVTAVVGRLRAIRERNHFAEMINSALRGGHG